MISGKPVMMFCGTPVGKHRSNGYLRSVHHSHPNTVIAYLHSNSVLWQCQWRANYKEVYKSKVTGTMMLKTVFSMQHTHYLQYTLVLHVVTIDF
jgi:hypothetical protein